MTYKTGDRVRIASRYAPGHVRTPFYVRGCLGTVERVLDAYLNPEREAFGANAGTETRLYRIRVQLPTIWATYDGARNDVLELEIYEHWLEPINEVTDEGLTDANSA